MVDVKEHFCNGLCHHIFRYCGYDRLLLRDDVIQHNLYGRLLQWQSMICRGLEGEGRS
jgi:hypothetical protein